MARRGAAQAATGADKTAALIDAGLDALDYGFAIFDRELRLVAANKAFASLRGYPRAMCRAGTEIVQFYRFNAERGDYGPGDPEAQAWARVERVRERKPHALEYTLTTGRVLSIRYTPVDHGGLVLAYDDITERKRAEQQVMRRQAELQVAMENMAGALAYTDDALNIVLRNNRFTEMYPAPKELLEPGRPYPLFLRYLAEHGYYGPGDVDALVARRVESLRNPTGKSFEDHAPDGRVYEVNRRRAAQGGTVTVITDITRLKQAEAEAARQQAQFHVAIDNMAGALAYTDQDLNIVVCNNRYAEMYPAPRDLLRPGRPYPAFLRYLAENGYYGAGDVDALVARRVESLRNPSGKAFEDVTPDGNTYRVVRRRAETGGTVTVITDITELKRTEAGLLEAKRQADEANRQVSEKNRTLESLSAKLSRYLSPQLYKSIFSGEKNVEVTSQRKKLTVFFSDIAGFTETTDLLESEELTALLNQYLREMSAIALEYGATIDKFIGDAIMLFFGDPETRGAREDALACVRMAIAMQQRMRDLQAEWRERGQEHVFQLRIGINTGYCTVGNFGSDARVDYTIIGNEVNLASRLQSHADLGGILLAHETYSLVKDAVVTEETGTITVKGFPHPVRTHRVVGLIDGTGIEGRIIRQEQEGLLLVIDRKKLSAEGRADAIRILQEAAGRLRD
ncbi:MAG: PAS-domain containing protein [Alphaproteobacteria bacterium]|nr:PAS-domain containing protein [Alphaproteobacteria bacterium]